MYLTLNIYNKRHCLVLSRTPSTFSSNIYCVCNYYPYWYNRSRLPIPNRVFCSVISARAYYQVGTIYNGYRWLLVKCQTNYSRRLLLLETSGYGGSLFVTGSSSASKTIKAGAKVENTAMSDGYNFSHAL